MDSLTVSVVGPYKSGKTTLVNKLQQRKGAEEDVSFYYFKYSSKNVTLIDTPGDMDVPTTIGSVLSISDAVILCVSPDIGINFQVGEQIIMAASLGISRGIVCITKTDISTSEEVERLSAKITALLKGTSMENFEIVPIDINNEQNIADVRAKVAAIPYDGGNTGKPFRILIDHAFESKGMSVAVGTLSTGKIFVHSDGTIVPSPFTKDISINSIQINQEDRQSAEAGDRVGVSIKGVWPWDLPRGVEIRQKGSFRDLDSGTLRIEVPPLYKQPLVDGALLTLICNWQSVSVTLSGVKREGDVVTASFTADKNFCFDGSDRILLLNKDLPIRVLRIAGKATVQ